MIKQIFEYNSSSPGGTEYMAFNFHKKILPYLKNITKYYCVCLPGPVDFEKIKNGDSEVIYWMHNYPDQLLSNFKELLFPENGKIKYVVAVSETQKQNLILDNLSFFDPDKIIVIPNAIDPVETKINKFNNTEIIKIINMSASYRGMDILIDSVKKLDFQNIELRIFNDFNPDTLSKENYDYIMNDDRIMFYGKTPRSTLQKYIMDSHIHAYPATFRETFCMSQAEAMSAGCLSVYGKIKGSAISEVSNNYGISCEMKEPHFINENYFYNVETFSNSLNYAIKQIINKTFNANDQVKYINNKYSWKMALENWQKFDDIL